MLEFLFSAVMIFLLALMIYPFASWTKNTVLVVLLIAIGVYLIDHEAGFLLTLGVVLLLPWTLLKDVPRRRLVYFTGLFMLVTGNAAHLVWIWFQDYPTYDLLPALYFFVGLAGGLLVFNLLALILYFVYRKRSAEDPS
jgi:hypothetical protein